jgi:hypothetical protein
MNWLWDWLATWRAGKPVRVRRVIVVVLEGLEPSLVDHHLGQGLLQNLALLSDIGTRVAWGGAGAFDVDGFKASLPGRRVRVLSADSQAHADLPALCATDRRQQERMIGVLRRRRSGVIVAVFDLVAQLARLYGPRPDAEEQLVIRDVYARMDEVVGKAYSFVDERTALLAAIRAPSDSEAGLIFSNVSLDRAHAAEVSLPGLVLQLLGAAPNEA